MKSILFVSVYLLTTLLIGTPALAADSTNDELWDDVLDLIDERKFEAADGIVVEILQRARQEGDEEAWARALIERLRLRNSLRAPETAVRDLRAADWPEDPVWRSAVELFYAEALLKYFQRYSYEIRRREYVDDDDDLDLKQWTTEQLTREIDGALAKVWSQRADWGNESIGVWTKFMQQNNYPARIRGTLRDAVTYIWAEHLANTALWLPGQQEGIYRLDFDGLLTGSAPGNEDIDLTDPTVHPLLKLSHVLEDLRTWHLKHERYEAALEVELEKLRRLRQVLPDGRDRVRIRQYLETILSDFDRGYTWWSMGQWQLAKFLQLEDDQDSLIRAHLVAARGARRHPDSHGGELCALLQAQIEMADYGLRAMSHDAAGKRSILIRHKNTEKLYFGAWRYDLPARIDEDQQIHPDRKEIEALVKNRQPDLRWSEDLPATEDYREHQTFTRLPSCSAGAYIVVASVRWDFAEKRNVRQSVDIIVTDLVITTQPLVGRAEVMVRSGRSGQALGGVDLKIYRPDRRRRFDLVAQLETAADGRAQVADLNPRRCWVLAQKGDDLAVLDGLAIGRPADPRRRTHSFIYTDRTVYRPGQTVHWKTVGYRGDGTGTEFQTVGDQAVTVRLMDANGQDVATLDTQTNTFGSASGSFVIPDQGLLGGWVVKDSFGGGTGIRVEEYKRPTYEVSLLDPETPLHLNEKAVLKGQADYLFGLPVTSGQVSWRVTRSVDFWRRGWGRSMFPAAVVASGQAELDADGRFSMEFTTHVDPRLQDDGDAVFRYAVDVDVTDDGGETRSARRTYNLGFVSVQARIDSDVAFATAGRPAAVSIRRHDLNQVPQPGQGSWFVHHLDQPDRVLLPAEEKANVRPGPPPLFQVPGDTLNARWEFYGDGLNRLQHWGTGQLVTSGTVVHGDDGMAELRLPALDPGAYRLRYETRDASGGLCEVAHDFIVAAAGSTPLQLPLVLKAETGQVSVGGVARFLLHSALPDQDLYLQIFQAGRRTRAEFLNSEAGTRIIEIPVTAREHQGLKVTVSTVKDHQHLQARAQVVVPWDEMKLDIEFVTFRDRLVPGGEESFQIRITAPDGVAIDRAATELLAYMYDRSLDIFAGHNPPQPLGLFAGSRRVGDLRPSLGQARQQRLKGISPRRRLPVPYLKPDRLLWRPGTQGLPMDPRGAMRQLEAVPVDMVTLQAFDVEGAEYMVDVVSSVAPQSVDSETIQNYAIDSVEEAVTRQAGTVTKSGELHVRGGRSGEVAMQIDAADLRTNFAESAFFLPHVQIDDEGLAVIEFKVPDSVTDWNVWVHALTTDLRSGSARKQASSVKDLMVRPYLPRFLREGDTADLKVVVNNAGAAELKGELELTLEDPETGDDLGEAFGLQERRRSFRIAAGGGVDLVFSLRAPDRVGSVVVRVVAQAGHLSDGEQRLLPVLPGRMHLVQSRFAALDDVDRRELHFPMMAADDDATLIHDQLVVTIDAQLLGSVLSALPYLVDYPYECVEQTLNRYLSASILDGVYGDHPQVMALIESMPERDTRYETWIEDDPNRRMLLEETPWLRTARGGRTNLPLINTLDPEVVAQQRRKALERLTELQGEYGGFSWFPGGPPSAYMTLYVLQGFARGAEFGVEAPRHMIVAAWRFVHEHFLSEHDLQPLDNPGWWPLVTKLNYLLSSYPEEVWQAADFSAYDRKVMLDLSFEHWREHSLRLKGYLALTLLRAGRADDARLVYDSVMDAAKFDPDVGTYWAPEDRAWLWYNDTVESHAFILRVLTELDPESPHRKGVVQWLLLKKKLGHWKSTRATAEVVYALVHFMQHEGTLGIREAVDVRIGKRHEELVFEPDAYTGRNNQIIIPGEQIDPKSMSTVVVEKETRGLAFASATWHFSTEKMPEAADGDLFGVTRAYFRRHNDGVKWVLTPLNPGDPVEVGDQIEVQLYVTARQSAEYVHLRDPRGAGFEPEHQRSGYRWQMRLGYYEEIRDSGANFFFHRLPLGQYTLKYRLRASMAGAFRVGPATLQSMYAPEFTAHSAGSVMQVEP